MQLLLTRIRKIEDSDPGGRSIVAKDLTTLLKLGI